MKRDPSCTLCKLHATAQHVCLLGTGPRSGVMIVGEAPGKREDDTGKPFVGRAGSILEDVLEDNGFSRKDVFITNAVSCRPPDNRTPTKAEIKSCKKWLDYQIEQVRPKFILLLGNVPLQSVTGKSGITSKRGRPFEQGGIIYLPTFHPAFLLHNQSEDNRALFERDVKLLRSIVDNGEIPREENLDFVVVDTIDKFKDLKRALKGCVSFDLETASDDPAMGGLYPWAKGARIVAIGFGTKHKQWVIPAVHPESPWSRDVLDTLVAELEPLLRDCVIVAHNGKFDFLWMWVFFGVQWQELFDFDTMLAHYILDENDLHDLKYLARKYCGAPDWDVDKDTKQGFKGLSKLALYQAHDLYYTRTLRYILGKLLQEDVEVKRVFDHILMPCARLFTEVEYDGVCVDIDRMGVVEKQLKKDLRRARVKMREWGDINWGSPQQLAALLFDPKSKGGFGLEVIEKTATGRASTSESVIKRIDHPIAETLLKFRGAKQQLSFFIEGWKPYLHRSTSVFLHPSFKLHGTVTGRLSCVHPNLQQIPRDALIRSLIIAPPGYELVEADLSQIELRIAAELAQERHMLEAFRNNIDIHWLTAMRELERGGGGKHVETIKRTAYEYLVEQGKKPARAMAFAESLEIVLRAGPSEAERLQKKWNETDPEKLWKEIRKKAKAVNFGYLYGMWWKKFKIYARDNYGVTLTDEQAEQSRDFYFQTFSDLPAWHTRQRRYARRHGYVRSLSRRKRRLPAAMSITDTPERREAERQAINSPVQSFANEINLMSALQLRREFSRDIVRIVGTVHDSILLWVKKGHVEEVTLRLLEIMTRPELFDVFEVELGVPILAEAKVGPWGKSVDFRTWRKTNGNERRSGKVRLLRSRATRRANVYAASARPALTSTRKAMGRATS